MSDLTPSREAWLAVRDSVLQCCWTAAWSVSLPIVAWTLPRWVFPVAVTLFFGAVLLVTVLDLIHSLREWRRIRTVVLGRLVDDVHDL